MNGGGGDDGGIFVGDGGGDSEFGDNNKVGNDEAFFGLLFLFACAVRVVTKRRSYSRTCTVPNDTDLGFTSSFSTSSFT